MKTKAWIVLLAILMVAVTLVGCSSKAYDYKYDDYIKLGDYSKITIKKSEFDKEIKAIYEAAADSAKSETTYSKSTDGVLVEDGDTANIDYTGKIDGVAFSGGTATKKDLVIGSGQFIPGFEDGLIGMAVGATKDINVTFPTDYSSADLRGKAAVFTVTVNSIKRTTYPEFNDANVKEYTEYETKDAFIEGNKEDVMKVLAWVKFFDSSKIIKYPKKELTKYYDNTIEQYTLTAASIGIDLSTYISWFGIASDLKSFFYTCAADAKSKVKQDLILYSVIEKQGWNELDDSAKYGEAVEKLWNEYKEEKEYTGDLAQFKKEFDKADIKKTIYLEKLVDMLVANSVIEDDVTKQGLINDSTGTRYYKDDVMQKGWQSVDVNGDGTADKCYFNDNTGYLVLNGGYVTPENAAEGAAQEFHKFTDKGVWVGVYNNEFYKDGTKIRYFENGVAATGWKNIDTKWYYFDPETGFAAVGEVMVPIRDAAPEDEDTKVLGNFDENGVHLGNLIGWVEVEGKLKYYYADKDGFITYAKEIKEIDGYKFYFGGKDGYLATKDGADFETADGFVATYGNAKYVFYAVELDGTKYAIKTEFTGFVENEGAKYYFKNGVGLTGWVKLDDGMYYFSTKDGKALDGTKTLGGKEYTFVAGKLDGALNGLVSDEDGNLRYYINNEVQNGVHKIGDDMYFFDGDKDNVAQKDGWADVNGDKTPDYYIEGSKIVVSKDKTIDGITYTFDADGKFVEA